MTTKGKRNAKKRIEAQKKKQSKKRNGRSN